MKRLALLLLLVGCAPRFPQHSPGVYCFAPNLDRGQLEWKRQVQARWPDAIVVMAHGGVSFKTGRPRWTLEVDADRFARFLRLHYPNSTLVVAACNEFALPLHERGAFHPLIVVHSPPKKGEVQGLVEGRP